MRWKQDMRFLRPIHQSSRPANDFFRPLTGPPLLANLALMHEGRAVNANSSLYLHHNILPCLPDWPCRGGGKFGHNAATDAVFHYDPPQSTQKVVFAGC